MAGISLLPVPIPPNSKTKISSQYFKNKKTVGNAKVVVDILILKIGIRMSAATQLTKRIGVVGPLENFYLCSHELCESKEDN